LRCMKYYYCSAILSSVVDAIEVKEKTLNFSNF
jgi:hypothetical protein